MSAANRQVEANSSTAVSPRLDLPPHIIEALAQALATAIVKQIRREAADAVAATHAVRPCISHDGWAGDV
jgi:hypothetical protein